MLQDILTGIKAYGGSLKLIGELKLWKYFAVPMLISFFTAFLIGLAAWGLSDDLGQFISRAWAWEWGADTIAAISIFLGVLAIIALGLVLYKHIIMALSAPFMGPVSSKIEWHLLGASHVHRKTSATAQLWRSIRINARNMGMELLLFVPISIIGFIPVIGVVSPFLFFWVQSYYAGFGNMDYTLERHFNYSKSIAFVKKNRGTAVGNGIIFMLLLFIPVIGIILVLPLSVTAATTETIKLLDKEICRVSCSVA